MKKINREAYYMALGFFLAACQLQGEVRNLDQMMTKILGESKLNDAIYDSQTKLSKETYDQMLLDAGIEVEWKPDTGKSNGGI